MLFYTHINIMYHHNNNIYIIYNTNTFSIFFFLTICLGKISISFDERIVNLFITFEILNLNDIPTYILLVPILISIIRS